MRRLLLLTTLVGFLITLSGCATDKPVAFTCQKLPQFTHAQLDETATNESVPVHAMAREAVQQQGIGAVFAEAYQPPGAGGLRLLAQPAEQAQAVSPPAAPPVPRYSDALILSGGGQWGAYGAGFIKGWRANGRLPARIVTGISTGALQATYAYLGDDDGLVDAYTITSESQLVHRYGSTFFLNHASTADIAPLRNYVAGKVGQLIPKVAAEYTATHRKLFVGSVDGLTGEFNIIDLTAIATQLSDPERQDCYVAALIASAAVPVIFRQVTINQRPWLDGGVRHALFLPEVVRQIDVARRSALARGTRLDTDGKVWAVKNGETTVSAVDTLPAQLLPTIDRLRTIVFNEVETDSLDLASVEAQHEGLQLFYTSADGWRDYPQCKALPSGAEDQIFDPDFMKCQISYGQSKWTGGQSPWRVRAVP
jgi:predicted acylesterase/phospholipase RssA